MSKFTSYTPRAGLVSQGIQVDYLRNEENVDWYEYLQTLAGQVISVDENNVVTSIASEPSLLFPENAEVFECPGNVEFGYVWNGTNALKRVKGFAEIKDLKRKEILKKFSASIKLMTNDIPQAEIDSFSKQELEATKYTTDNTYVSPLLMHLVKYRGITVNQLVTKIQSKVALFEDFFGKSLGKKQAYLERLDQAIDIQQVEEIEVNYAESI